MRLEAVDRLLHAGVLDVEVDLHLLGVGIGRRRSRLVLLAGGFLLRVLLGFLLRLLHPPAQLGERGDLVALLLQIQVVDLLLREVDDLFRRVGGSGLAVALDGDRGRHAFTRRLAAEHVEHAAEHAGELDVRFLVGADVGAKRIRGQDQAGHDQGGGGANTVH